MRFDWTGPRKLAEGYQVEFERCEGIDGEPRACEVSMASSCIPKDNAESQDSTESSTVQTVKMKSVWQDKWSNRYGVSASKSELKKYLCVDSTSEVLHKGIIKYFDTALLSACIYKDGEILGDGTISSNGEIFCDASAISKSGSYTCVKKGVEVEYREGRNPEGLVVAVHCTGRNGKPIGKKTVCKRTLDLVAEVDMGKKRKYDNRVVDLPDQPELPEGKNPMTILHEIAVTSFPRKTVKYRLAEQSRGWHPELGLTDKFVFKCRVDGKTIGTGWATTKKKARMYAANKALTALSAINNIREDIGRIRCGLPNERKLKKKRENEERLHRLQMTKMGYTYNPQTKSFVGQLNSGIVPSFSSRIEKVTFLQPGQQPPPPLKRNGQYQLYPASLPVQAYSGTAQDYFLSLRQQPQPQALLSAVNPPFPLRSSAVSLTHQVSTNYMDVSKNANTAVFSSFPISKST